MTEKPDDMNAPRISQTRRAFSLTCAVEVNIRVSAATIWTLLTDSQGFPRFSGLMLPLVKGSLPEFGPVFERYAADLKREAERTAP